ncbi:MAG: response regulator [Pyrinomonadaceae bacterium]
MLPKKILVVEDDEEARTIIAHILRVVGHEVCCAETADEAMGLYAEARESGEPFDLMFVDLRLAGSRLRGCDFVRQVRERFGDHHVPAHLLTAFGKDPEAQRCADELGTELLTKPDQLLQLPHVVNASVAAQTMQYTPAAQGA